MTDRPILFEVFTETADESAALEMMQNVIVDPKTVMKDKLKKVVKDLAGDSCVESIRKFVRN